jgi:hypothetical protein
MGSVLIMDFIGDSTGRSVFVIILTLCDGNDDSVCHDVDAHACGLSKSNDGLVVDIVHLPLAVAK